MSTMDTIHRYKILIEDFDMHRHPQSRLLEAFEDAYDAKDAHFQASIKLPKESTFGGNLCYQRILAVSPFPKPDYPGNETPD